MTPHFLHLESLTWATIGLVKGSKVVEPSDPYRQWLHRTNVKELKRLLVSRARLGTFGRSEVFFVHSAICHVFVLVPLCKQFVGLDPSYMPCFWIAAICHV